MKPLILLLLFAGCQKENPAPKEQYEHYDTLFVFFDTRVDTFYYPIDSAKLKYIDSVGLGGMLIFSNPGSNP